MKFGLKIGLRHGIESSTARAAPPVVTGPPPSGFFPIYVWLQNPSDAAGYAAIGINTYYTSTVNTTAGYDLLLSQGMKLIGSQAAQSFAVAYHDQSLIIGWVIPTDEPDNCELSPCPWATAPAGENCCCTQTSVVQAQCNTLHNGDPQRRPVIVECGRCLGNPANLDRGTVCTTTPHGRPDYPLYYQNCDWPMNDIYPVNNNGSILTYVADACDYMYSYAPGKSAFQTLECTQIRTGQPTPSPAQVRCEAWLALIHDAKGIGYFAHINPGQTGAIQAGILSSGYEAQRAQMTTTNAQIQRLAQPLNTFNVTAGFASSSGRIDFCVKDSAGSRFLFATNPTGSTLSGTFTVSGVANGLKPVIDEGRNITVSGGQFTDTFAPLAVHLYQLT